MGRFLGFQRRAGCVASALRGVQWDTLWFLDAPPRALARSLLPHFLAFLDQLHGRLPEMLQQHRRRAFPPFSLTAFSPPVA
jgi:hypothetical protein